jgi:hypothetical protein
MVHGRHECPGPAAAVSVIEAEQAQSAPAANGNRLRRHRLSQVKDQLGRG